MLLVSEEAATLMGCSPGEVLSQRPNIFAQRWQVNQLGVAEQLSLALLGLPPRSRARQGKQYN